MCLCEVREQLLGVGFVLRCGAWGLNSGGQAGSNCFYLLSHLIGLPMGLLILNSQGAGKMPCYVRVLTGQA